MSLNSFLACWSFNGLSGNSLRGSFQSIGVSSVGDVDAGVEPGFFEELFKCVFEDQGVE